MNTPSSETYRVGLADSVQRVVRRFAPPSPFPREAWRVLLLLGLISIGTAFQGSLPTASMTYIGREFGKSTTAQSHALAWIRMDIVLAFVVLRYADRIGRRRTVLLSATLGPVFTALCSLSPNLLGYTILQIIGRGFVTATLMLISVFVVEEMPATARSWASSFVVVFAALGSGLAVGSVFVADISLRVWRFLYLIPLLSLAAVWYARPRLAESERFRVHNSDVDDSVERPRKQFDVRGLLRAASQHRVRLLLVTVFYSLLSFENVPTRQFQNEFLRLDRGFNAKTVALFSVFSNLPGMVGIVVGGLVGDRFGHRRILAVTLFGFALGDAGLFLSHGNAVWAWSMFGALMGAASIPIIGIYGSEVFPTSFRSSADGITAVISRGAGALGLLLVGWLVPGMSRGHAIALTTIALFSSVLLLPFLPETSGRTLEEINPEDTFTTGYS